MSNDIQVRNPEALILGTGEFAFAPDVTTVASAQAAGYIDFGNIVAVGFAPKLDTVEHEGSYRGVKRVDQIRGTKAIINYELKCDEWNLEKLKIALFGDSTTAFLQTAISVAAAADALPASCVKNLWYDILKSGVRVREILTLTVATLTENTDFVVDYKAGRIRFLTTQTSPAAPQITASAVVAGDAANLSAMVPFSTYVRNGIGRLMLFDDTNPNKLVYDHTDFGCQISLKQGSTVDGKKFGEIDLDVRVTSPKGVAYCAEP
ncbi:MAG: hypothetical protein ACYDH9_08205 [Limisphaerales bacterium]